jgi:hypothetical protein
MGRPMLVGRDRAPLTDCGVASSLLAAYVADTVHRWDLRRPAFRVPAVPGGAMMADSIPSTSLAPIQPVFTDAEWLALAGTWPGTAA